MSNPNPPDMASLISYLQELDYREIQIIAKKNGVRANMKHYDIVDALVQKAESGIILEGIEMIEIGVRQMELQPNAAVKESSIDAFNQKDTEAKSQAGSELKSFEDAVTVAERKRDDAKNELNKKDEKIEGLREKIEGFNLELMTEGLSEEHKALLKKMEAIAERSLVGLEAQQAVLLNILKHAETQLVEAQAELKKAKEAELKKLADDVKEVGIGGLNVNLFENGAGWSELMGKSLKEELWEFSKHPFFDFDFAKKLWIRPDVFENYYSHILSGWKLRNWVYLSGSPGVGKSSFGLYFMMKLLTNDVTKNLIYCRGGLYYHLTSTSCFGIEEDIAKRALLSEEFIGVYDSPSFQPHSGGLAKRLLISSPKFNEHSRSTFYKEIAGEKCCVRLYFPRLSRDEADQMRKLVPPVVENSLEEIEKAVGLVPRAFYVKTFIKSQEEKRQSSKTKYIDFLNNSSVGVDAAPHCLISIEPKVEDFCGYKLPTGYSLDLSCEKARRCVFEWKVSKDDLARIKSDGFDPLSRSAGISMEIFAHHDISTNGIRFGKVVKSKPGEFPFEEFAIEFTGKVRPFPSLCIPSKILYGDYCVPDVSNFPEIDSFGVTSVPRGTETYKSEKTVLFLFQMTAAKDHTFHADKVKKIIQDIRSNLAEGVDSFTRVGFVWVVREKKFKPDGGWVNFDDTGYKGEHFVCLLKN
eukprot:TRINITY_DN16_c0_g2_i1.p1 TRINITY_DN16_c0_g2~~TRINITY_DN16_c0_g2_i1.p1  ORF type:complete len:705 (-),score=196.01 TRINITY_DN16_c0_g2_i1:133-2217(-)